MLYVRWSQRKVSMACNSADTFFANSEGMKLEIERKGVNIYYQY
jgi:hypothetical protein